MIAAAIIATMAFIAVPFFKKYMDRTRLVRAVLDIRTLEEDIDMHALMVGNVPDSLSGVERANMVDPWGNRYQYLRYATEDDIDKFRNDRFLVPMNVEYDLYSMGEDGASEPPLSASVSRDDIIRANDGAYVGLASEF